MHSDFQKMFAVFGVFAVLLVLLAAVTKINLKEQATPPGSNGQLLFNNNGVVDAEDPVVSQATAANLNAQVVGNIASGASDSGNPVKTGCVFNTTQPTVTNGQRVDCQASNRGEIFVAPGVSGFSIANTGFNVNNTPAVTQSGGPWTINVTQWASAALGAMANYGTSPGAVLVPGVNAFITNNPTVTANAGTGTFTTSDSTTQTNTSNTATNVSTLDTDLKADPCGPAHAKSYAFYDASTNGATKLVSLVSGKVIYVCSYSFSSSSSTANTLKLVYGTKVTNDCDTGQTSMTPGIILQAAASQGPIGKVNPNSAGLQTAASKDLCVLTNAAQAAQAEVSYVQQ